MSKKNNSYKEGNIRRMKKSNISISNSSFLRSEINISIYIITPQKSYLILMQVIKVNLYNDNKIVTYIPRMVYNIQEHLVMVSLLGACVKDLSRSDNIWFDGLLDSKCIGRMMNLGLEHRSKNLVISSKHQKYWISKLQSINKFCIDHLLFINLKC
ncbi:30S ribosomal protein S12 [Candidatus Hodgkinia cicadicola]|nr:30S ribosomal protein S12 [Candidatus Hodgkinia cicadicola]